jgi:hypothetical protein
VKWRVILPSGDRVGPFTGDQLLSWLLNVSAIRKQLSGQQHMICGSLTGIW